MINKKVLSSGDVIMVYGISIAKGTEWAWLRPAATGDAQGDTAVAAAVDHPSPAPSDPVARPARRGAGFDFLIY